MFVPPFCPRAGCALHDPKRVVDQGGTRLFRRCGSYSTKIPGYQNIQRFRCPECRRTFSWRTLSSTYRQKKPFINSLVWSHFSSGVSRRQAARVVGVARGTIEHRFIRLAQQSEALHEQSLFAARLTGPAIHALLDEMESFARDRFHPVSIPIVILDKSYFIVASRVATIRRKGTMAEAQKKALEAIEKAEGRREDTSRAELTHALMSLKNLVSASAATSNGMHPLLRITTDEKPLYTTLIREVFANERGVAHATWSGKKKRDNRSPLFPINHTNAEHRYHVSMLIRRTWCHAKTEAGLVRHLAIYRVFRNFRRWETNDRRKTPATSLGIVKKRLDVGELFRWNRLLGHAQLVALGAVAIGA